MNARAHFENEPTELERERASRIRLSHALDAAGTAFVCVAAALLSWIFMAAF